MRNLLPMVLLVILTACSSKYPYPPQYVTSYEVSPRSIPVPPPQASAEYNRAVDRVVALQSSLTPADLAAMKHEDHISPDKMLLPVLGEQYSAQRYPQLYDFMNRLASDSWRIGDDARDYWRSPRPWYTEHRVKLHVSPIYSYGYPSGHTTTFGTWAYVLGDLFPEERDAFLQHAWSVAENRIKGGAHYPHDIEGGKRMAKAIYTRLQAEPEYVRDFALTRREIRQGGSKTFAHMCPQDMNACAGDHARR